jgi:hypothetical protein
MEGQSQLNLQTLSPEHTYMFNPLSESRVRHGDLLHWTLTSGYLL